MIKGGYKDVAWDTATDVTLNYQFLYYKLPAVSSITDQVLPLYFSSCRRFPHVDDA